MKSTYLGLASLTLSLAFLGCGDSGSTVDDVGTEEGGTEVGDGDGDTGESGDTNDTTGDGDGDGDTTTGDGDGDTGPEPDMDMDGTPDSSDNCPGQANPNQLDFDGNGMGNVCDILVFNNVTGTLNTTASADAGIGSCQIPIMLEVTSGQVQVLLDDEASIAGVEITSLEVADILDQECDLGLATATVSLKDFMIANSGDPFPVTVPHSLMAHDNGSVAGDSDMPHPVLSTATLEASIDGDPPMPSPLELDGSLPIFTLNVTGAGAMGTMAWADAEFVLATDVFMIEDPFMLNIDFDLTGLVGSLIMMP